MPKSKVSSSSSSSSSSKKQNLNSSNSNTESNGQQSSLDRTDYFDVVFWFGDLNFLIVKEKEKVEKKISYLRERNHSNYEEIINHDELNRVITEDRAFRNFLEGRITFEPTYKYDLNSDNYDTSEKCRIPSYCVISVSFFFLVICFSLCIIMKM